MVEGEVQRADAELQLLSNAVGDCGAAADVAERRIRGEVDLLHRMLDARLHELLTSLRDDVHSATQRLTDAVLGAEVRVSRLRDCREVLSRPHPEGDDSALLCVVCVCE